jgi:hypothetical protein
LTTTGTSGLQLPATTDAAAYLNALWRITGNGLKPRDLLDASRRPTLANEVRYRGMTAAATAIEAIRSFRQARPEIELVVLFVTQGYDTRLAPALDEVARAAAASHATICTIDPFPSNIVLSTDVPVTEWDAYRARSRDTLGALARARGGMTVFTPEELDALVARFGSAPAEN